MSEMSEYWKDVSPIFKEESAKKRKNNFEPRLKYAIEQFEKNNIPYKLCNPEIGHFNLLKNNKTIVSFWSYTGAIYSPLKETDRDFYRGIVNCIKLYKKIEKEISK